MLYAVCGRIEDFGLQRLKFKINMAAIVKLTLGWPKSLTQETALRAARSIVKKARLSETLAREYAEDLRKFFKMNGTAAKDGKRKNIRWSE